MIKKTLFSVIVVLVIIFALAGCGPSDAQLQAALAKTQTAQPTATATLEPTATATPTITPVPPKLGIDNPVIALGVDLRFYSVQQYTSIIFSDKTVDADPGYTFYIVRAESLNGTASSTYEWPEAGDAVRLVGLNGEMSTWYSMGISAESGPCIVEWVFMIPQSMAVTWIYLPGGVVVDLSPLLP